MTSEKDLFNTYSLAYTKKPLENIPKLKIYGTKNTYCKKFAE